MSEFNIYQLIEEFKRFNGIGNLNAANSVLTKLLTYLVEHLDPGKAFTAFKTQIDEAEQSLADSAKDAFSVPESLYAALSVPAEDAPEEGTSDATGEDPTSTDDSSDEDASDESAAADEAPAADPAPTKRTRARKN
jgi:hypothetical protein